MDKLLRLILFLSSLQVAIPVYSQVLIPRVGFTLAKTSLNIGNTPYWNRQIDFNKGFVFGLGYEIPIKKNFSVLSELSYVQKGFKRSDEHISGGFYLSGIYKTENIEVPIFLKYSISKKRISFYSGFGISLAYGLQGKVEYDRSIYIPATGSMSKSSYSAKIDFSKRENGSLSSDVQLGNKYDFSLQCVLGVFLRRKIAIDVRYTLGLSDFEFFENEFDSNRVLQFSFGVPIQPSR